MGLGTIGFNAMLGLKAEVAYGASAGDSDHWLPILGHTLQEDCDIRDLPFLGVANDGVFPIPRDSVEVARMSGGQIDTIAMYDDKAFLLMLLHALGEVSTSLVSGSKYAHTFATRKDGVVGLSMQAVKDGNLSSPSELFVGGRVTTMDLSWEQPGWMSAGFGVILKNSGGVIAVAGTPTATAHEEVLAHQGADLSWNSRTIRHRSGRLTFSNNLARRPYVGSKTTDRPVMAGFGAVGFEFSAPWEDVIDTLYSDYRSGTVDDMVVAFTGTGDNTMQMTLGNFRITAIGRPVQQAGELMCSVSGRAFANPAATTSALEILVTNSNSSAT